MRADDIIRLGFRMLTGRSVPGARQRPRKPPRPTWLPPREWTPEFIASREWLSNNWQWEKVRVRRLAIDKHCFYCGRGTEHRHDDGARVILNVDHIWCRRDYPHLCITFENTATTCNRCNKAKGNDRPYT